METTARPTHRATAPETGDAEAIRLDGVSKVYADKPELEISITELGP